MESPEPAADSSASTPPGHPSAVAAAANTAASPTHAERVRAAEQAVAPWWPRAGAAVAVLVLAALGLLGVLLVAAGSAGTLSGSFILTTSGTVTLIALAVAALVLVLAMVLILRHRRAGTAIGLLVGILLTAVLGWVATSIVSFSLPDSTGMVVALSIGSVAAAAATLVLSLTHGRLLALGRIRDEVGVRTF